METHENSVKVKNVISELVDIISPLSQEELNTKIQPECWSPAQIAEHLLMSYDLIQILKGKTKLTERPIDQKVEQVKSIFLNFDIKMQSPEFIIPSNDTIDKDYLIRGLKNKRDKITEAANTLDLSVTCTDFSLPQIGEFTRFEWISFIIIHTERHIHQLKNTLKLIREQVL